MDAPLVSIIIPCYNARPFVAEAIGSALEQTYVNREVIVIDDGSTDGSQDVVRSFNKDVRFEAWPNRGAGAARNRGLSLARGEMVQFLDADDVMHPDKLTRQVRASIAARPLLTYCDYNVRRANGQLAEDRQSRDCQGLDPIVFVLAVCRLQTSAPLHWKWMLTNIGGFREDLRGSQEYDLHLRLAAAGARFFHIREVLYTFRETSGSMSSDYVRTVSEQLKFLPNLVASLQAAGDLTEERARAVADRLAQNGRQCLQRGGRKPGLAFLEAARAVHPSGGLEAVYSTATRWLYRMVGPVPTEMMVGLKRRLLGQGRTAHERPSGPAHAELNLPSPARHVNRPRISTSDNF